MTNTTASPKVLVTGGEGCIGRYLIERLRQKYGKENVLSVDLRRRPLSSDGDDGLNNNFVECDVTDFSALEKIVASFRPNWVFHLATILTMACEADPQLALKVNVTGFQNVIELARLYQLRMVSVSSLLAFGPTTPKLAPDVTIQRPMTLYGCTKVHNELIGEFYHRRFGVDFRCLRFPVVLSADGGDLRKAIASFACCIFEEAVKKGACVCDVPEDTCLPYVFIDDCIDGTVKLMATDDAKLTQRIYNIQAFSATASQLVAEIQRHVPDFRVTFTLNDAKKPHVDALVHALDDANARNDWAWQPHYDLQSATSKIIATIKSRLPTETD